MARYLGGCHCGRVRFEVEANLSTVVACNCSICEKKAYLHVIVPQPQFHLLTDASALTTYRFGTGVAQHQFCSACGVASFYVPRSDPDKIDVNARCLDGVDVAALRPRSFDGRNWEGAAATRRTRGDDPR